MDAKAALDEIIDDNLAQLDIWADLIALKYSLKIFVLS
jgi:hypothetical protein